MGELELHGHRIAIRFPANWLTQAVYPVTVDPRLQNDVIFADGFESGDPSPGSGQALAAWSAAITNSMSIDGFEQSGARASGDVWLAGDHRNTTLYVQDDTPVNEVR